MAKGKFRWWRSLSISIISLLLWSFSEKISVAQMDIKPDSTLGAENSIPETQGDNTFIEGGASRGINLFHSFEEFNIDEGKAAYFTVGDTAIENIFSRITGSDPSDILGTLGTCISSDCPNAKPAAALYFINPNGIFFGPEASLDLGGSFVATTANAIEFGERGIYGTAPSEIGSDLLTVNPSAFLFNQPIAQTLNSIESRANLSVLENHSLLLVGGRLSPNETSTGDIVIREGRLRSPGGQIAIGGLTAFGKIELSEESNQLSLIFPDNATRSNFRMTGEVDGFAELDVTSGNGGNITIHARNIDILGGSDVCAGIGSAAACGSQSNNPGSVGSQGGDIRFNASETVRISDPTSVVINDVYPDAVGNSGDTIIEGQSLLLMNGGQLSADTSGRGNSGKIIIDIADSVLLQERDSGVFIFNNVNANAIGSSGGVEITTGSLEVLQGAQIQSLVLGQGTSGGITIRAEKAVVLDGREKNEISSAPSAIASGLFQGTGDRGAAGRAGDVDIIAGSLSIENRAQILNNTQGVGDAGDISIEVEKDVLLQNSIIITEVTEGSGNGQGGDIQISANSLALRDGSALLADTENIGDAGNIIIDVRDAVLLQGRGPGANNPDEDLPSQISTTVEEDARGRGGEISISTSSLSVTDSGFISANTFGDGRAGNIDVQSDTLRIADRALITARSVGTGVAGGVTLNIANTLNLSDGGITTEALNSSGGNITIRSGDGESAAISGVLILEGDSDITTDSLSDGGNITIRMPIVAFDDSDILARSQSANGGNITLGAFFSETGSFENPPPFEDNEKVDINADGDLASGNITIADTRFIQNELAELTDSLSNIDGLVLSSCVARRQENEGSIVISSSGNLRTQPDISMATTYSTGSVGSVEGDLSHLQQPDGAVIEPQAVYSLPDGRLVMSRPCL